MTSHKSVAWEKHQPKTKPKGYQHPQQEAGQWLLQDDYPNNLSAMDFIIVSSLFLFFAQSAFFF